jgi:DNA-binding PadR family transcriptional regulator
MDQQKIILQIIQQSPAPLGWYGIETRLGTRGVILSGSLLTLLKNLVQVGFLTHAQAEGHPHGVYSLTDLGRAQLNC